MGEGSISIRYSKVRYDLENVKKIMDELKEIISEKLTQKRFEVEKNIFWPYL